MWVVVYDSHFNNPMFALCDQVFQQFKCSQGIAEGSPPWDGLRSRTGKYWKNMLWYLGLVFNLTLLLPSSHSISLHNVGYWHSSRFHSQLVLLPVAKWFPQKWNSLFIQNTAVTLRFELPLDQFITVGEGPEKAIKGRSHCFKPGRCISVMACCYCVHGSTSGLLDSVCAEIWGVINHWCHQFFNDGPTNAYLVSAHPHATVRFYNINHVTRGKIHYVDTW